MVLDMALCMDLALFIVIKPQILLSFVQGFETWIGMMGLWIWHGQESI